MNIPHCVHVWQSGNEHPSQCPHPRQFSFIIIIYLHPEMSKYCISQCRHRTPLAPPVLLAFPALHVLDDVPIASDTIRFHSSRATRWSKSTRHWSTIGVFCTGKNRVVKIAYSSSEMVLWTTKHTMIYSGSGPSSEVIALHPAVWYWRWTNVIIGWAENSRSSCGEGGNDLVPPTWRVESLL
jgi:hypothetical protein